METLYDVLGIEPDADSERIRAAYREQAKRHHPDVSEGDGERFKRLTTARDVLLDDARRTRYDRLGHRRYAVRHLDSDEWPVGDSGESSRQRSRSRRATGARRRRRRSRRVHRERSSRSSGPEDGLVALATYWPVVSRVGLVLTALLALAFVLSALSL